MLVLLFFVVCVASHFVEEIVDDIDVLRASTVKLNLAKTFFSGLESYHEKGVAATDKTYPWAGQVVHSRTQNYPYMCTAICVSEGVFMTAARCIFTLKVTHTSVVYRSNRIDVRAFVVPTKPTEQQFDDIGFVVLDKSSSTFSVAQLYTKNEVKRTDDSFNWFAKMDLSGPFKVIGFVMEKEHQRLKLPDTPHNLKELPIVINIDLCWNILTNGKKKGFHVPCYYSCALNFFIKKDKAKCGGYLAVEGAAVMHVKTKKILGVATWGPRFTDFDLPVGFAVVNSKAFQDDWECAKKIRKAKPRTGSYQNLC